MRWCTALLVEGKVGGEIKINPFGIVMIVVTFGDAHFTQPHNFIHKCYFRKFLISQNFVIIIFDLFSIGWTTAAKIFLTVPWCFTVLPYYIARTPKLAALKNWQHKWKTFESIIEDSIKRLVNLFFKRNFQLFLSGLSTNDQKYFQPPM